MQAKVANKSEILNTNNIMTNVRMRRFFLLVGFLCLTTVVNAAVIGWKDAASGLWVDWVDKNTKDAVKVIQPMVAPIPTTRRLCRLCNSCEVRQNKPLSTIRHL